MYIRNFNIFFKCPVSQIYFWYTLMLHTLTCIRETNVDYIQRTDVHLFKHVQPIHPNHYFSCILMCSTQLYCLTQGEHWWSFEGACYYNFNEKIQAFFEPWNRFDHVYFFIILHTIDSFCEGGLNWILTILLAVGLKSG